jgi:dTDP-L-rhamnose 4-epimerase
MRALVTGGGGFIGSHCVDALVARGHEVIVVDSFEPTVHAAAPNYLNAAATYISADVADEDMLMRALRGVDVVSHQAAVVGLGRGLADAPRYTRVNGVGTAVLLRCLVLIGVPRLVLASSMVVYGEGAYRCPAHGPQRPDSRSRPDLDARRYDPRCAQCSLPLAPEPIAEDAALDPRTVYAATKVHQEHLAFAAMRQSGLAVTALRYHNTYGARMPRDTPYAGVASLMRSQIAAGGPPRVFEDGRQLRDFVDVRDVARANVLALERSAPAIGAYNVGSGEPHTILELATALSSALGGSAPVVTGEHRPGDVRHIFASSAKAARDLGYQAEVRFVDGIGDLASAPLREPAAAG